MQTRIRVKRISGRTTFKLLFVGFLVFHIVSTFCVTILVMAGALPLEATNPESADSSSPMIFLAAYLLIGVLFSPIWVGALWLSIWPGVWLFSLFRPMHLGYIAADDPNG